MQIFKVFSVLLLVSGQFTVSHAVTESQKIVAVDPYVDAHFGSDVAMKWKHRDRWSSPARKWWRRLHLRARE